MAMASWLVTRTTSSSRSVRSTLGTKPAPMPWICIGVSERVQEGDVGA